MRASDLTGRRFGRLTVVRFIGHRGKYRSRAWECLCDCGELKHVLAANLLKGNSTSCGCFNREVTSARLRTHGHYGTPEYIVWNSMKTRCFNPRCRAYQVYGGRGILMCERWRDDFSAFLQDMGPRPSARHTIERRDNNRGYEPTNCLWLERAHQSKHRRCTWRFEKDGTTLTLRELAVLLNIKRTTVLRRLQHCDPSVMAFNPHRLNT